MRESRCASMRARLLLEGVGCGVWSGVEGSLLKVEGLGFIFQGLGYRLRGLGRYDFSVWGVQISRLEVFRFQGLGGYSEKAQSARMAMATTCLRVEGLSCRGQESGFMIQGSGFRVQGLRIRAHDLRFRVGSGIMADYGSGFRV